MKTTTIRIAAATRDLLNEIARRRGQPASKVLAALVQEADDRDLLAAAFTDWERLCDDPAALDGYRAGAGEREAFDTPLQSIE